MRLLSNLPSLGGNVLYLDIGGSAIKSATLPCHRVSDFFAYLAKNPESTVTREKWHPDEEGDTLAQIVSRLASESGGVCRVAISIGGSKISSNGRNYDDWMKRNGRIEINLAETLEHELGLQWGAVSIRTDSLAWGQGVRSWLHETGKSATDGIGLLVVGTGVAFTVVTDTGVTMRHLHNWDRYDWSELARFANFTYGEWIHNHLGAGYFRWRDNQIQTENDRRKETNKRYQLVLEQLSRKHKLSQYLIGGGCAPQFQSCVFTEKFDILTLDQVGFDPGFLPFIGMAS